MRTLDLGRCADPAALFRRISREPGAFWLDGGRDGDTAFLGFGPTERFSIAVDGCVKLADGEGERTIAGNPLEAAEAFVRRATPGGRAAAPHALGFFAYELAPWIEGRMRVRPSATPGCPLAFLARYEAAVVCRRDRASDGSWSIAIEAERPAAADRVAAVLGECDLHGRPAPPSLPRGTLLAAPEHAAYVSAVRRAQEYIAAGDAYQVNLAQAFVARSGGSPAETYLRLRSAQGVPHGCFLDAGELVVLSNSPERFLRVRGDQIETEPIKGTRGRSRDREADAALRADLLRDPKERAEHVMIVDLERNDLGRVCTTGSVCVPSLMRADSFATVHHLVSTVRGRLRPDASLADILRATFPGGSITGAPKIRAAQIIAELESEARDLYTGAIAWFFGPRDFDSSIAIRTAVARDRMLTYRVGAGIVADSDAEREYEECWLKARPFLSALGLDDLPARGRAGERRREDAGEHADDVQRAGS